jgi:hypothetical protein
MNSAPRFPIDGDQLYHQRARAAFPVLVRQAWNEQPISYSDLAEELGMPNPRNLNDVLGAIGRTIELLSEAFGAIPPIQFLAVQKNSGVPGVGISAYVSSIPDFKGLSLWQKRRLAGEAHSKIWSYPRWREVLMAVGLEALPPSLDEEGLAAAGAYEFGAGESAAHKELKALIASAPTMLGLKTTILSTTVEHALPSGDSIDVLLKAPGLWIAVEVKTESAPSQEILRGLFQCVKYRVLLKAVAGVLGLEVDAEAVLALGGTLPPELLSIRNSLGITVMERVGRAGDG